MKTNYLFTIVLFLVASMSALAQNVGINATGSNPDGSAMLDISSTAKGLLIPRLTTTQQNAIASPANGLLIFNTTANTIMMNTGTAISPVWTAIVSGTITNSAPITYSGGTIGISQATTSTNGYLSSTDWNTFNNKADASTSWSTLGNAVASAQKIGTTTNFDFPFITNNVEKMRLTTAGNLGIGISPTAVLHLKAGTATPNTAPLKFTSGVLLNAVEAGAVEFDGSHFYGTAGSTRYQLDQQINNAWAITGNAGTTYNNYVGTSDNHSVRFKANNIQSLVVDSLGSVGVGLSPSFMSGDNRELLLVDGGSNTLTNTLINAIGTNNDYLQLNIQNLSNGGFASSDVVATANNGTLSTVYIDMGINSNAYNNGSGNILNGSNSAYLYATGSNFYIGNGAQNKDLVFFTNTAATGPDGTERLRIAANGNIGIGTTSTGTYKLNVSGSVNASGGYTQTSDLRLKKNIAALDYGLNEVVSLRPVRYNWKDTAHKENKIGFIAQEVRKVIPEVVTGDESKETIGMSYSDLVPVLVNAIKEQQKQIDELKKDIQVLKIKK